MKNTAILFFIYGALVLGGGLIGFAKAHSLPSLIMGSLFAGILIASAFGIYKGSTIAYFIAISLAVFLSCFFGVRFANTLKFFPAGMMMLLSLLTLVISYFLRATPK